MDEGKSSLKVPKLHTGEEGALGTGLLLATLIPKKVRVVGWRDRSRDHIVADTVKRVAGSFRPKSLQALLLVNLI